MTEHKIIEPSATEATTWLHFDHTDDCGGTLCSGCGCCLHCADDCPCRGCKASYCGCEVTYD